MAFSKEQAYKIGSGNTTPQIGYGGAQVVPNRLAESTQQGIKNFDTVMARGDANRATKAATQQKQAVEKGRKIESITSKLEDLESNWSPAGRELLEKKITGTLEGVDKLPMSEAKSAIRNLNTYIKEFNAIGKDLGRLSLDVAEGKIISNFMGRELLLNSLDRAFDDQLDGTDDIMAYLENARGAMSSGFTKAANIEEAFKNFLPTHKQGVIASQARDENGNLIIGEGIREFRGGDNAVRYEKTRTLSPQQRLAAANVMVESNPTLKANIMFHAMDYAKKKGNPDDPALLQEGFNFHLQPLADRIPSDYGAGTFSDKIESPNDDNGLRRYGDGYTNGQFNFSYEKRDVREESQPQSTKERETIVITPANRKGDLGYISLANEDGDEISFFPSKIFRDAGGTWKVKGRRAESGLMDMVPSDKSDIIILTPENRQKIETKYQFKIDDISSGGLIKGEKKETTAEKMRKAAKSK